MKRALWPVVAAMIVTMPAAPTASPGSDKTLSGPLQILEPSVAVRCALTVGGGFDAKTGALSGELVLDPQRHGDVEGTLTVDLRTLQTGIGLRDDHMRDLYLEVHRGDGFSSATLSHIRLDGFDPLAAAARVTFRGLMTLHGQERAVAGTANIRRSGHSLHVQAAFPVKVSDFAIASPVHLGIGVRNEVAVAVSFQIVSKQRP
jgi:polyisoprenoid-binding protein YceI